MEISCVDPLKKQRRVMGRRFEKALLSITKHLAEVRRRRKEEKGSRKEITLLETGIEEGNGSTATEETHQMDGSA